MGEAKHTMRPWLSWIEHLTTNQRVGGSNPSGRARDNKRGCIFLHPLFYLSHVGFEPPKGVDRVPAAALARRALRKENFFTGTNP
jgi:hypothetical protein